MGRPGNGITRPQLPRKAHPGQRQWLCSICGQNFSRRDARKRHIQTIHRDHPQTPAGQLYRCSYHGCDPNIKVFPRRDHYTQHLRHKHKLQDKFFFDLAAACHDLDLPLDGPSSPSTMTTTPGSSEPAEAPGDMSSFTGDSLLQ